MMTVTVWEIYSRAARFIGGRTGLVTSSTTTATILGGLVNTTGDNTTFAADRLILPLNDAGSRETLITKWVDLTGSAEHVAIADPADASPYIVMPREMYTLQEMDDAFYKALRDTKRTYRQTIPITPYNRFQDLSVCTWLQGADDVDAVTMNVSPIMLHNEDFSLWQEGGSAAPDGWTLSGTGASVSRVTGGLHGPYGVQVTAGETAAQLYQEVPAQLAQWITRRSYSVATPMRGAAWVKASASNAARVGIYDGSTTTYSDYITGDGTAKYPNMTLQVQTGESSPQTTFRLVLEVAAGETATYYSGVLMQNTTDAATFYQIKDQGSTFYAESEPYCVTRNIGGVPTIEFQNWPATYGQLFVYSRRPYPLLDSYTDVVEDQYAAILVAGLLVFLLQNEKPQQDRSLIERVLLEQGSIWTRRMKNTIDLPVAQPPVQHTIGQGV
jgi:hypothetical protein